MTDYFVRKTGSDAAAGTSAGAAWLTIDKAANTVAAGDTVYIGSGTYRELVTMDTAGSSGSSIQFIGDLDGSKTGDGGSVIISAYDGVSGGGTRVNCLDPNGLTFIEWHNVVFNGSSGTEGAVYSTPAGATNYEGVLFKNCVFLAYNGGSASVFVCNAATTPTTDGLTYDGCFFYGRTYFGVTENATAQQNMKCAYKNCIFRGATRGTGTTFVGVLFNATAGTHGVGGVSIVNCDFDSLEYAIHASTAKSTTYPVQIRNCTFMGISVRPIQGNASFTTAVQYGNCRFAGVETAPVFCTDAGGNDATCDILMRGGIGDLPLYAVFGWSPYKPHEPMYNSTGSLNYCVDGGSATYAPDTDMYGNSRPMGRGDDIGAVEARARPQQEATTINGGTYSARFEGAGYYEAMRAVSAASTTISVYGLYDSNYTGSKPKIEVLNIPGVAGQSDTMTGGANAWEQISCTFTPTSAGWVRVRISSQDTSATGQCFFDDLAVT